MIHIVLFEPKMPQNTGNIMRTCAALNAQLHLIEPLGFVLDEKRVKRAVMDYIDQLNYVVHKDFDAFLEHVDGALYYLTRFGTKTHSEIDYAHHNQDIYLVFGSETAGLPKDILKENINRTFRIPMSESARSLNLSNAVAISGYEVARQLDFKNLSKVEVLKGSDYIEKL
ncbi:MAG: tRNA (cytidine(34)-2'-O)-methyltransferase [Erysipelothrix sp.]|nr:tRNA (cytidine(34)-2'-O)-methyltransferase [Erysipelothrix sp.]